MFGDGMPTYYDKINKRLVQCNTNATSAFWDKHWENIPLNTKKPGKGDFVLGVTSKYLKQSSTIFEGVCGPCNIVHNLYLSEYNVIGLDYAQNTLHRVKNRANYLQLICGDVFDLPLSSNTIDGYWSLGVIEHFYNGYDDILKEAQRVIASNGYLFITFPTFSLLRKIKSKLNRFELLPKTFSHLDSGFYQFMLDAGEVSKKLNDYGFTIIKESKFDAAKGLKDEIPILHPLLSKVYTKQGCFAKIIRFTINKLFSPIAGHMSLIVAQKR